MAKAKFDLPKHYRKSGGDTDFWNALLSPSAMISGGGTAVGGLLFGEMFKQSPTGIIGSVMIWSAVTGAVAQIMSTAKDDISKIHVKTLTKNENAIIQGALGSSVGGGLGMVTAVFATSASSARELRPFAVAVGSGLGSYLGVVLMSEYDITV